MSIERIRAKLSKLEKRCSSTEYALKPAPWPRNKDDCKNMEEAVEVDVAKLPDEILRWKMLRTHRGRTLTRDRLGSQALLHGGLKAK